MYLVGARARGSTNCHFTPLHCTALHCTAQELLGEKPCPIKAAFRDEMLQIGFRVKQCTSTCSSRRGGSGGESGSGSGGGGGDGSSEVGLAYCLYFSGL